MTDAQYLQQTLAEGDLQLRLGLAESSAANIGVTGLRDRCSLALSKLFSDPEVAVRSAASDCFRRLKGDDLTGLDGLVSAFLGSPAAESSLYVLLDCLMKAAIRNDLLTLRACEDAVKYATANPGKPRGYLELENSRDLVLRTYHQVADPDLRERSLNIIDRLLGLDVVGLEDALSQIERGR